MQQVFRSSCHGGTWVNGYIGRSHEFHSQENSLLRNLSLYSIFCWQRSCCILTEVGSFLEDLLAASQHYSQHYVLIEKFLLSPSGQRSHSIRIPDKHLCLKSNVCFATIQTQRIEGRPASPPHGNCSCSNAPSGCRRFYTGKIRNHLPQIKHYR